MFFGEKYIPLLRGDWCVVKAGAVYLENTKNVKISNSKFEEIGGNAVFFYGYNEGAQITENEFRRIGATAVQVIGSPKAVYEPSFWNHQLYPYLQVHKNEVEFPQCQGPACEKYPRDIIISENHIQGTGIYEKQSCGVNLSVASGIKILHNTIHNSARSCINVNDGSFGGHEIACNDIYDSQRETTDHGPFNSWGRDRFWSVPDLMRQAKADISSEIMKKTENIMTCRCWMHTRRQKFIITAFTMRRMPLIPGE